MDGRTSGAAACGDNQHQAVPWNAPHGYAAVVKHSFLHVLEDEDESDKWSLHHTSSAPALCGISSWSTDSGSGQMWTEDDQDSTQASSDDLAQAPDGKTQVGDRSGALRPLIVKNTFLDLEDGYERASLRRVRSAPELYDRGMPSNEDEANGAVPINSGILPGSIAIHRARNVRKVVLIERGRSLSWVGTIPRGREHGGQEQTRCILVHTSSLFTDATCTRTDDDQVPEHSVLLHRDGEEEPRKAKLLSPKYGKCRVKIEDKEQKDKKQKDEGRRERDQQENWVTTTAEPSEIKHVVTVPEAKQGTAEQLRNFPLRISMARHKSKEWTEGQVVMNSPDGGGLIVVGKVVCRVYNMTEKDGHVKFYITLYDDALNKQHYKRKPGQDEAMLLMQLLLQGFGDKKLILGRQERRGNCMWTTIFYDYEHLSVDGSLVVEFEFAPPNSQQPPIDINLTQQFAFDRLRIGGSMAWKLRGCKSDMEKLVADIAQYYTTNRRKDCPAADETIKASAGPARVGRKSKEALPSERIPGCIVVARSLRSELRELKPELHNKHFVLIDPKPCDKDPDHWRVGTFRDTEEKCKTRRIHKANLFIDETCGPRADAPMYQVLLHRHGEEQCKAYLRYPENGKCKVSLDKAQPDRSALLVEPSEILYDTSMDGKSKQTNSKQTSKAPSSYWGTEVGSIPA